MNKLESANVLQAPRGCPSISYSEDLLAGSRDVQTPYGSIRVYEWGLETGKKVLLIHGLSTPSPALAEVGQTLANGGCRLMVMDLFGRGFSDTPSDLPHDTRLYTTQILLALSTSPISWTGKESHGFAILGYSMGGAIAMAFARWFPQLVTSIVLLAPGGLYDRLSVEYHVAPVKYPWLFPYRYVAEYVRGLLNGYGVSWWNVLLSAKPSAKPPLEVQKDAPLNVTGIVDWEIDHHPGFVHSVTNALKWAPIVQQHAQWTQVRMHIEGTSCLRLSKDTPNRLLGSKILLLLGKDDVVLPPKYQQEIEKTMGSDNIVIREFEGGHSFPILHGQAVGDIILDFWR